MIPEDICPELKAEQAMRSYLPTTQNPVLNLCMLILLKLK